MSRPALKGRAAGRELDMQVAAALGWSALYYHLRLTGTKPGTTRIAVVPRYSTDVSAAVEALCHVDAGFTLRRVKPNEWQARLNNANVVVAESPALAICLAILEALDGAA